MKIQIQTGAVYTPITKPQKSANFPQSSINNERIIKAGTDFKKMLLENCADIKTIAEKADKNSNSEPKPDNLDFFPPGSFIDIRI